MAQKRSGKNLLMISTAAAALSISGRLECRQGPVIEHEIKMRGVPPAWELILDEDTGEQGLPDAIPAAAPSPSASAPASIAGHARWGAVPAQDRIAYGIVLIGYLVMASAFVLQVLG